jgi:hypothetical protein
MNRGFSQIYAVEHNQEQLWSETFVDEALELLHNIAEVCADESSIKRRTK